MFVHKLAKDKFFEAIFGCMAGPALYYTQKLYLLVCLDFFFNKIGGFNYYSEYLKEKRRGTQSAGGKKISFCRF